MRLTSIRVRLLLAAAATIVLAMLASGASIALIFERHVENRVKQELEKHFIQLVAALEVQPEGNIRLTHDLADPRFDLPLSGLYWQIDLGGTPLARSRSLWDQTLNVPTPPGDFVEAHVHELAGPDGQNLFSLEKAIYLEHLGQEKLFVVTIGLERGEISDTVLSLTRDVVPALAVLGLVLLLATWFQVSLGLRPLAVVERAVQGIREGGQRRIEATVADEVKPLVNELNALLEANDTRNRAARQRAADLAHGLRTPLTILGSLSRTVEEAGLGVEAENIRLQTEHMRQQVERELAKAITDAQETPQWLGLRDSIERLTRVVVMGASAPGFTWSVEVPRDAAILMSRNDLNEILGNLLENAQAWGRSCAAVRLKGSEIAVEDDGPGVDPEDFDRLTERGFTRARSSAGRAGSGLGLAIVQDLVGRNGISMAFGTSVLGGLAVRLQVPLDRLRPGGGETAAQV
jgi:signal transduction histidine kinase